MANYTFEQILGLATLCAEDYMRSCTGPTIRGKNGEKHLRGTSLEEVAKKNEISISEAASLTVDLSCTGFDDLPEHWQKINIQSAESLIKMMAELDLDDVIAALDFDDPATRAEYGSLVHEIWLKMPENSWALGGDLDKPFADLPESEQDKDIQQLRSYQKWYTTLA